MEDRVFVGRPPDAERLYDSFFTVVLVVILAHDAPSTRTTMTQFHRVYSVAAAAAAAAESSFSLLDSTHDYQETSRLFCCLFGSLRFSRFDRRCCFTRTRPQRTQQCGYCRIETLTHT